MNQPSARALRPVSVSMLAVVALVAALLAGSAGTHDPALAAAQAQSSQAGTHSMTAPQVAFHDQMRKLWEDHVTWTRLAIVTFADGSPGFGATATRLLDNQVDIGNAIKPFYGNGAGNQLAALLHDHIAIAVELLQDAKSGDTAAFADADARWYANANDISDLVSSLDPVVWPDAAMRDMMKVHLDQTLAEASAELNGNYGASVADYDAIHQHILEMADMLSSGIIKQFPGRFR